jgi:dihydrofolate reductase
LPFSTERGEKMNLIVNADKNWGIGKNNELLVHIPNDMKMFRETTTGHVVVMGRKTLESFPGGKPLPKRTNVVLTTDMEYEAKGAQIVHSKEELMEFLASYDENDIYIIGGESIYRMMLPYCKRAIVTKLDYAYDADTFFPNLDELEDWKVSAESEEQTYFDVEYTFMEYTRR